MLPKLYQAFVAKDMSLLEINPLVVTKAGQLICLDAKIGFDDSALYRHADIAALRDPTEEDAKEIEASHYDLNYVALDGTIGCMVNGAGLAMATMDIIKLYGETPANFLDVGGGASKDKVTAAFKIITSDPNVKGILVNIFGGIMRCDIIAEGVVAAVKEVGLRVPLVVRLEGTNVALGKEITREIGPQCHSRPTTLTTLRRRSSKRLGKVSDVRRFAPLLCLVCANAGVAPAHANERSAALVNSFQSFCTPGPPDFAALDAKATAMNISGSQGRGGAEIRANDACQILGHFAAKRAARAGRFRGARSQRRRRILRHWR